MKTLKPLRLSILTRPFLRAQSHRLGVTVIGMHSLGEAGVLLPEPELWKTVSSELGNSAVLDLGMPKASAEFLVTGKAYTCHQEDKTRCAVRMQVGGLRRDFTVSGDRFWVDGRATAPQPFDAMPLDWQHAFGGPGFASNPLGIGHAPEEVHGQRLQRLPNVEEPGHQVEHPDARRPPACPGAIDLSWPERISLLGKDYDDHWRENLFPGFSRDMDWRFFNAAPMQQRWPDARSIPGGTPYALWNMHPTQAILSGQLPAFRARAFLRRKSSDGALDALSLDLSTAWFFPHLAQVVLIFHGEAAIQEDDASDISHIMPALEQATGPARPLSYYQQVFERRCDPEKGAIHAFLDEELLPGSAIGPWLDQLDARESILERNIKSRGDRLRAELTAQAVASGHKAQLFKERPVPAQFARIPTLAELPEFIESTRAFYREQEERIAQAREEVMQAAQRNDIESRKVGFESSQIVRDSTQAQPKGPPRADTLTLLQGVGGIPEATRSKPLTAEEKALLQDTAQRGQSGLLTLYRATAQHQACADRMDAGRNAPVRERVAAIMATDRKLTGMDLTGAGLAGMDLRGADLRDALLENANLQGARLEGADLSGAVLVRADLRDAVLDHCVLTRANLSHAHCESTHFSAVRFDRTQMEKLSFTDCCFDGSDWTHVSLLGTVFDRCQFRNAKLSYLSLAEGCQLRDCDFGHASLEKVLLVNAVTRHVSFAHARIESCSWVHVAVEDGSNFSNALLRTTSFVGTTSLRTACFEDATLVSCTLREMPLDGANFRRATLDTCDLSSSSLIAADLRAISAPDSLFIRTDFTRASLRGANLMNASLQKAVLVDADLRDCSLFRADASQWVISERTETRGAYIEQVKTVPRRDQAVDS